MSWTAFHRLSDVLHRTAEAAERAGGARPRPTRETTQVRPAYAGAPSVTRPVPSGSAAFVARVKAVLAAG